ncbi:hypothetical protein [Mycoplasma zalophi]|uniref:S1 motif domain-containing protein n=1 Tax=Mycoplasma zalophi TaxID=191287 RepID=A0ABS6DPK7_9MOLU|nr:hypothetical protein [Mycoplasma zalophi]MBU4690967.1 hypothetical protein [Mycoplasma zalophi]MBU4692254.1 hypothetical protein [Mycoplasma zalophi]
MNIDIVNKVVQVKVTKIYRSFVLLENQNKQTFRLNLKDVSDYYIGDLEDIFRIGEEICVFVKEYNEAKNNYIISFKNIHPKFLRNPFEFEFNRKSSFEKLLKFTKRKIKNDW